MNRYEVTFKVEIEYTVNVCAYDREDAKTTAEGYLMMEDMNDLKPVIRSVKTKELNDE